MPAITCLPSGVKARAEMRPWNPVIPGCSVPVVVSQTWTLPSGLYDVAA